MLVEAAPKALLFYNSRWFVADVAVALAPLPGCPSRKRSGPSERISGEICSLDVVVVVYVYVYVVQPVVCLSPGHFGGKLTKQQQQQLAGHRQRQFVVAPQEGWAHLSGDVFSGVVVGLQVGRRNNSRQINQSDRMGAREIKLIVQFTLFWAPRKSHQSMGIEVVTSK